MFVSASEVHWFRFRNDGHLILFSVAAKSLVAFNLLSVNNLAQAYWQLPPRGTPPNPPNKEATTMLAVLPDPPAAQSFFFLTVRATVSTALILCPKTTQCTFCLSRYGTQFVIARELAGPHPSGWAFSRRRSLHPQTAVAQNGRNPNCSQELALLHNNQVTCVEQRSQCPLTQDQKHHNTKTQ